MLKALAVYLGAIINAWAMLRDGEEP